MVKIYGGSQNIIFGFYKWKTMLFYNRMPMSKEKEEIEGLWLSPWITVPGSFAP
jgi:hypothetical protein